MRKETVMTYCEILSGFILDLLGTTGGILVGVVDLSPRFECRTYQIKRIDIIYLCKTLDITKGHEGVYKMCLFCLLSYLLPDKWKAHWMVVTCYCEQ
jgi:hypothetical protein